MSDPLTYRLNQILPKLTSDDFLCTRGIGNEIDLPPRTSPPSKLDSEPFEVHSTG